MVVRKSVDLAHRLLRLRLALETNKRESLAQSSILILSNVDPVDLSKATEEVPQIVLGGIF